MHSLQFEKEMMNHSVFDFANVMKQIKGRMGIRH